ncbi:MAG TPA: PKD domain-containing protein [Candidatus Pacearchaeota archaeon]|nr:PKD domain-containing protein [Candidatus Pacearchaeota archaeon]
MKKGVMFLLILISLSFISASFTPAKDPYEISNKYAPGSRISGWINISVSNEPTSTSLEFSIWNYSSSLKEVSGFKYKINLTDLINKTGLTKTCIPSDCKPNYGASDSGESTRIDTTGSEQEIITYGLKIIGESFEGIDKFSMKIESDASKSMSPQIEVDILADEKIDWVPFESTGVFSSTLNKGCYDSDETEYAIITDDVEYCNHIEMKQTSPVAQIGAIIKKQADGTSPVMNLTIRNSEGAEGKCTAKPGNFEGDIIIQCIPATKTGNFSLSQEGEFEVCINAKKGSENLYKIKYSQDDSCSELFSEEDHFELFIKTGEYAALKPIILNETTIKQSTKESGFDIEDELTNYIQERYDNNCEDGCVIPIKITSNVAQTITLSSLSLTYTDDQKTKISEEFYEIQQKTPKVSFSSQKINLESLNIFVPSAVGTKYQIKAEFVNSSKRYPIFTKNFTVEKVPVITHLNGFTSTLSVPLSIEQEFKVTVNSSGSTHLVEDYKWNFGDKSPTDSTKTPVTKHKYNESKTYNLSVTLKDSADFTYTKNFTIIVQTPQDSLDILLERLKESSSLLENSLKSVSGTFHQNALKKYTQLEKTKTLIQTIEQKMDLASSDADYLKIMQDMNSEVSKDFPRSVNKGDSLASSDIFPMDLSEADSDYVATASGESYNTSKTKGYKEAIQNWEIENLIGKISYVIYNISYATKETEKVSIVKISLPANQKYKDTYLIFPTEDELIDSGITLSKEEGFYYLKLNGEAKEFEVATTKKILTGTLPFFISPVLSKLVPFENGKPEEQKLNILVEYKWAVFVLAIIVLIILAAIIYVLLGRWYQTRYEHHLFPNKNQLYNIINYVHASKERNAKNKDISDSLIKAKWSPEQVRYVMKKYAGKNPGMPGIKDPKIKKPQKESKGYTV